MADDRTRCLEQSKTPGRATRDESKEYLLRLRDDLRKKINMPAQDHRDNCLGQAITDLCRLERVERSCEQAGHMWVYSPFVKLMSPPLRCRLCTNCYRQETNQNSATPPDAKLATEEVWESLGGY